MRKNYIFTIILSFIWVSVVADSAVVVIEDFNSENVGGFPSEWKARSSQGENLYLVNEDAKTKNRYLSITDRGESVQIGKEISWDIEKHKYLSWAWRVKKLPEGASEGDSKLNDSAAGVYVVFDRAWFVIPRAIKYVWSSTLPKRTVIEKGYTRIVVLQTGEEQAGKWKVEAVNVYEDYKRFFGKEPPDPQGVAILTDANATESLASADYDNFRAISGADEVIVAEQ